MLPRSEHCTTRRWHWHLNGQTGPAGTSGSSSFFGFVGFVSGGPSPEIGSSSTIKSMKPDWRKGRAQHTDTKSRVRQANLMLSLTWKVEETGQSSEAKKADGRRWGAKGIQEKWWSFFSTCVEILSQNYPTMTRVFLKYIYIYKTYETRLQYMLQFSPSKVRRLLSNWASVIGNKIVPTLLRLLP